MSIISEYSLWFLPICVIGGIAAAYILYNKDTKFSEAPNAIRRLLFVLRAVLISILLFLLLGPFIQRKIQELKKPVIVFLQDNSASILLRKDSIDFKNNYKQEIQNLREKLDEKYDVEMYMFGNKYRSEDSFTFSDKQTNISQAFNEISSRYYNRNLGAVILASDGIYNEGENPIYAAQSMNVSPPIYTIALGDTTQAKDNVISNVLHNSIGFKNNPFVVRIEVESHMLQGKQSKIELFDGKKKIFEKVISSNKQKFYTSIDCKITSNETGQKLYTAKIQKYDGEISYKNNEYTFSVEILESRQKVLILYSSIHPDIAAIHRSLNNNSNFVVSISSVKDFKGNVADYNCIVAHGFPQAFGADKEIVKQILQSNVPILYIYNSTMHLPMLETLQLGIDISGRASSVDEVHARYNKEFSLFDFDSETQSFMESAPPLLVPYGNYAIQAITSVLCWQNVGDVETNKPLIICNELQGVKRAFICGEGIWRWRMFDYRKNATFNHFDSFINKIIGYLALSEKRSLFSVQTKQIFSENEDVEFTSELYYKNFEPAVEKEIQLEIKDTKGKIYPFVFTPSGDFYKLQAGKFAPGEYSYTAQVKIDNSTLVKKGKFYVIPLHIEYSQTQANHAILNTISTNSGGKMYYQQQLDTLINDIKSNPNIVSISHSTEKRTPLIDSMLLLIMLICIAGIEWFFRKYYGTY